MDSNSQVICIKGSVAVFQPEGVQYPRKEATGRIIYEKPDLINSLVHQKVGEAFLAIEAEHPNIYDE